MRRILRFWKLAAEPSRSRPTWSEVLYGVSTKRLNEQVKRNAGRFPGDFIFRLSAQETEALNGSHFATGSQKHRDPRFPPFAFTERGAVVETWREYHDHLGTQYRDGGGGAWNARLEELFTNLLFTIATDVRSSSTACSSRRASIHRRPTASSSASRSPLASSAWKCSRGSAPSRWMSQASPPMRPP